MNTALFSWPWRVILAFALLILLAPAARSADKPDLDKLIRQLGSEEFDERERAQKSLETLGEDDLPTLRAAAKKSTDAEVQRRLADVIAILEVRFTKDSYAFIEKVGGRVVSAHDAKPVKARLVDTEELSVILIDAKVGDADLRRLKELGKVTCVTLAGTQVTDRGLPILESLPDLEYLCLDSTAVTDAGLAHLKSLKNLASLSLRDTKVKGKGLDHLKDRKGLYQLDLDGCDVTDDDLIHIVGLKGLTIVSLDRTKVTDSGLARFSALPVLSGLSLKKTGITDAGLGHLARVKELGQLSLDGTCVTAKGIADLKKALPKLKILGQETFDK
jgi:hypothetical protein